MYSIFQKNPNAYVSFFIFKKYFGIFSLIIINELCKEINSTQNTKSWKLKKTKKTTTLNWAFWKKIAFGLFRKKRIRMLQICYPLCFLTRSSPFPSLNPQGVVASFISAPFLYLKEKKACGVGIGGGGLERTKKI